MSADVASFWAGGTPQPQGSKRLGRNKATNKPVLIDDNDAKLKPWRTIVAMRARAAWSGRPPMTGPVELQLTFWLPRGSTVRRWRPTVKPDLDKLTRAVFDALTTAKVWKDDSQAVSVQVSKHYAEAGMTGPGVSVVLRELKEVGL